MIDPKTKLKILAEWLILIGVIAETLGHFYVFIGTFGLWGGPAIIMGMAIWLTRSQVKRGHLAWIGVGLALSLVDIWLLWVGMISFMD